MPFLTSSTPTKKEDSATSLHLLHGLFCVNLFFFPAACFLEILFGSLHYYAEAVYFTSLFIELFQVTRKRQAQVKDGLLRVQGCYPQEACRRRS